MSVLFVISENKILPALLCRMKDRSS